MHCIVIIMIISGVIYFYDITKPKEAKVKCFIEELTKMNKIPIYYYYYYYYYQKAILENASSKLLLS